MKGMKKKLLAVGLIAAIGVCAYGLLMPGDAQAGPFPDLPPLDCPQCEPDFCQGFIRCVLTSCDGGDCYYACGFDPSCRF